MALERWGIHIIGPDDWHDRKDEVTALREANNLNKTLLLARKGDGKDPFVLAVVKDRNREEV